MTRTPNQTQNNTNKHNTAQLTISCWILTEPHFATVSRHLDKTRWSARNRILRRRQLLVWTECRAGMSTILQKQRH